MTPQSTVDDKFALCTALLAAWLGLSACQRSPGPPAVAPSQPSIELRYSSGSIGTNGNIGQAFDRAHVAPVDAFNAQQALNKVFRVRQAQPHHHYEMWISTTDTVQRFVYWIDPFEYFTVERSSAGRFSVTQQQVPVTLERMAMRGEIKTSLWDAMKEQEALDMNWKFADVFGSRVDFLTEPRVGDSIRVIWSRDRHESNVRDGEILFANYHRHSGEDIFAFLVDGEYYDQNGRSMRGQFLRAPLSYRRISSGFTNARFHPILRYNRPHHGIDYAAAQGTPVQSIGDGVVIAAGWDNGLGRHVRIRHNGSYVSIYGHLSSIASGIAPGARVKQGQFIGRVGSTGLSTGPHLHFGFERGGSLVNFLGIKFEEKARTIPPEQKEQYSRIKKEGMTLLSTLKSPAKAHTLE